MQSPHQLQDHQDQEHDHSSSTRVCLHSDNCLFYLYNWDERSLPRSCSGITKPSSRHVSSIFTRPSAASVTDSSHWLKHRHIHQLLHQDVLQDRQTRLQCCQTVLHQLCGSEECCSDGSQWRWVIVISVLSPSVMRQSRDDVVKTPSTITNVMSIISSTETQTFQKTT